MICLLYRFSSETLVWAGTGPLGFSTRILQGASDVISDIMILWKGADDVMFL